MNARTKQTLDRLLITGASSGIGRAISVELSKDYDLVIHGKTLEKANETLQSCTPGNHSIWTADFAHPQDAAESLKEFLRIKGFSITHIVHSAGISSTIPARLITPEIASLVTNVNYLSPLQVFSVLSSRITNPGRLRSVVSLSSIWANFGATGQSLYSGSKAALDAAIRCFALEHAQSTRFNSISLGVVDSPMASSVLQNEDLSSAINRQYPLGIGNFEDIIPLVKFLLGAESKWMTGQNVYLDGGRSVNFSHPSTYTVEQAK
jgi:NAD(P)-dependent dehydrogenase (short-subunit alcohol dehydrogenase family)